MKTKQSKIFGGLIGAATGDAIGKATEFRNSDMIVRYFGGWVCDFVASPSDNLSKGTSPGYVTDDFSIAYYTAKEIFQNDGVLTDEIVKKAWIAGLLNPGNPGKAAREAIIMCRPTHPNPVSLSLGCAIAAAVAEATGREATVSQLVEEGIKWAKWGYQTVSLISQPTASTPVDGRIRLAAEIGLKYAHDFDGCIHEMLGCIGSGMDANESGPSAFGYLVAGGRDVMKTILLAANSGNDADTTAVMAAAMAGTLYGASNIPEKMIQDIEKANPWINFKEMTEAIYSIY